jgi:hypothetical protein
MDEINLSGLRQVPGGSSPWTLHAKAKKSQCEAGERRGSSDPS